MTTSMSYNDIIRKDSCSPLEINNYAMNLLRKMLLIYSMPFRFEWKFGDGSAAAGRIVEHCYAGPVISCPA